MWSFKHNEHPAFTKGFILLTPKSSLFSRDSRLELGDFLGRVVVERISSRASPKTDSEVWKNSY